MWKVCWNKGRLCWKIAKLFYPCHLKKLVRPETFGHYYVGCWQILVSTSLNPWYYMPDDSNIQNTTKGHSTGRTVLLVLSVYIPIVYVSCHTGLNKWNWRLNRDYWLLNYATISACRKVASAQNLCSEININRIWRKGKWRMKWNSKWWFHDCTINLHEADHLLSSTAKDTNLKTIPSLPHKPSWRDGESNTGWSQLPCTSGLHRWKKWWSV